MRIGERRRHASPSVLETSRSGGEPKEKFEKAGDD